MKHLLGIEGMQRDELERYLNSAQHFIEINDRDLKKVPALRGKTIINLFLEPSTRTRSSFEIAAKRLSADTINVSGSDSSVVKGETLLDTARNLEAMSPDVIVVRHSSSGAAHFLARNLTNTSIVNAGDGAHEHPTQALLDLLTLKLAFEARGRAIDTLKVAVVGDIRHSRVARSNLWAHNILGNEITFVGPPTLVPPEFADKSVFGANLRVDHNLSSGIEGADVVICLRMQIERQGEHFVPSLEEYSHEYCISERVLARFAPDCLILHPGPANRGTEITSEVLDGPRSLVSKQVSHGVAVRMAVLFDLITAGSSSDLKEAN